MHEEPNMPTFEREFHRHTHGEGIEDRFCLARDDTTGRVFIVQRSGTTQSEPSGGSSSELSVRDFLEVDGERQSALLQLIGTLIPTATQL